MITWSENYLMGIEKFDKEHKKTFQLAKRVIERMMEDDADEKQRYFVIREMVTYINTYFKNHVIDEEAYMQSIGYDGYELHHLLHQDFLQQELVKYQKILDRGECDKEDIWDFIGTGIGWLLEHIATADLAIVGRGPMMQTKPAQMNREAFEKEVNDLLTATMNMEMDAKIISTNYAGEYVGDMYYWKTIYHTRVGDTTLISGIEKAFVRNIAQTLFGEGAKEEMGLIRATVRMFDKNFWATIIRRFIWDDFLPDVEEGDILEGERVLQELQLLKPTVSVLFASNKGKFFIANDSPFPLQ